MDAIMIFVAQYVYIGVVLIGAGFFFLQPRAIQKGMVICGAIVAPLAFVLSRVSGALYYDPRPFVVGHFMPLMAHAPDNGFPSDHVLLTGAVAMVIWFYNRNLSIVLWVLALLIGGARVYVGIHHATDIIGSVVIVLVSGAVYYFSIKKYRPASRPFPERAS